MSHTDPDKQNDEERSYEQAAEAMTVEERDERQRTARRRVPHWVQE